MQPGRVSKAASIMIGLVKADTLASDRCSLPTSKAASIVIDIVKADMLASDRCSRPTSNDITAARYL